MFVAEALLQVKVTPAVEPPRVTRSPGHSCRPLQGAVVSSRADGRQSWQQRSCPGRGEALWTDGCSPMLLLAGCFS